MAPAKLSSCLGQLDETDADDMTGSHMYVPLATYNISQTHSGTRCIYVPPGASQERRRNAVKRSHDATQQHGPTPDPLALRFRASERINQHTTM